MAYPALDPSLELEFLALIEKLNLKSTDSNLKKAASDLALKFRSRLMDLATAQADYSDEYKRLETKLKILLSFAKEYAHPILVREYPGANS